MARIRSLHPEQWSDEQFASCSPLARLLAIGIRNEADDNGIFEWNVFRLRVRILPGDNCDMVALLDELLASNQVLRYEVDGKAYGLIRNFQRFQSAKKPTFRHPLPPSEIALPVGYTFHKVGHERQEGSTPVPHQHRTGSPPEPNQYETGNTAVHPGEGKGKGEGKVIQTTSDAVASSPPPAKDTADPKKALFDLGVSILTKTGDSEKSARSFLAKYAHQNETKLAEVLGFLATNAKIEPKSYIAAAFKQEARELAL